MSAPTKEEIEKITRALMDAGKIVEAGWMGLTLLLHKDVHRDAMEFTLRDMKTAFFAGAQHLFSSIMGGLEEDHEPTETDLRRMSLIHRELEIFVEKFNRDHSIRI